MPNHWVTVLFCVVRNNQLCYRNLSRFTIQCSQATLRFTYCGMTLLWVFICDRNVIYFVGFLVIFLLSWNSQKMFVMFCFGVLFWLFFKDSEHYCSETLNLVEMCSSVQIAIKKRIQKFSASGSTKNVQYSPDTESSSSPQTSTPLKTSVSWRGIWDRYSPISWSIVGKD